ncbi:torsin-1A-like isoform X4 [Styela clava]
MIANNLFKKGEHSPYFHQFNPNIHFRHKDKTGVYKDQLHSWIYHNVSDCGRSVFIFDEIDHISEGIMDVLAPFLGHSARVDRVDFRKTIFIFSSATVAQRITEVAFQHWRSEGKREEIKLRDTQEMLEYVAYNEVSVLKNSKLASNNYIDHFVPFLPLERSHVRKCIIDEMKRRNMHRDENVIGKVLEDLLWFPEVEQLYSTSGCKGIAHRLALVKDEL